MGQILELRYRQYDYSQTFLSLLDSTLQTKARTSHEDPARWTTLVLIAILAPIKLATFDTPP